MEWQPIETAPKDETRFIGWDGEIIDITWKGWDDNGHSVYVRADWVSWKPTRWMPLPSQPQAKEE